MNAVENMLAILEGDETKKIEKVKEKLNLHSERNARVLLHILENSPEKFEVKLGKEVHKLEEKLDKEYKKMYRKLNSYNNEDQPGQYKLNELKQELAELQQLL